MSGGEGYAERGIIPRCIEELFAAVERFQRSTPGAVTNVNGIIDHVIDLRLSRFRFR